MKNSKNQFLPIATTSIKLSSGTFFSQSLSLLSPIIILTYFDPKDVGTYSYFTLTTTLLALLYTLKTESFVQLSKNFSEAFNLLNVQKKFIFSSFIVATALSLITLFIFNIRFDLIFLLSPFAALIFSLYLFSREFFIFQNKISSEVKVTSIKSLLLFFLQLAFGKLGLGKIGLILPKLVSEAFYILSYFKKNQILFINNTNKHSTIPKSLKAQILANFLNKLIANVNSNFIIFCWPLFLTLKSLGIFYLALKIAQLPGNIIGENISKVIEKKSSFEKSFNFKKMTSFLLVLFFVLFILYTSFVYLSLPYISSFIKSSKWNNIIPYFVSLSPIVFINMSNATIISYYKVKKKLQTLNKIDLAESFIKNSTIILSLGLFSISATKLLFAYSFISGIFHLLKISYIFLYDRPTPSQ